MTVEKSNITLVQVAEAAGVSSMTVSRVLNGNRAKVKSSTFERVEQVIRDLNYVPNISARALAGARNFRIGLVYSASAPFSFFLDSLVVNTLDALTKIGMHTSVIKLSK